MTNYPEPEGHMSTDDLLGGIRAHDRAYLDDQPLHPDRLAELMEVQR